MLRRIVQGATLAAVVLGLGVVGVGCLDRPVVAGEATTKTNYTVAVTQNTIDKIDLLFDIDNSASMGDKEIYLEQAVPDLINRLVNPNCVSAATGADAGSASAGSSTNGSCSAFPGTKLEFPPVHNMHIGIISSSLGGRGCSSDDPAALGDPCPPANDSTGMFADGTPSIPRHFDDQAHLLNRTAGSLAQPAVFETESTSADTGMQNFLDWFPNVPANMQPGVTPTSGTPGGAVLAPAATPLTATGSATNLAAGTLEGDFAYLVAGVHNYGCGIESQLETWYRFLIQPDPYASIAITGNKANWVGVDQTIIQQRHDFLRPDSLVAIIVLSDENDSEIDVRSFGGQGYNFMNQSGVFDPPRGTSACETAPDSAACTSCAYGTDPSDPNCKMGAYTDITDWGAYINVRHVHMKAKYGIDVQFPLQRYVLGLTSPTVPDRDGEYPSGASSYQGGLNSDPADLDCANPLFAATLPTGASLTKAALCNASAPPAARTPDLVFYAHIGGVPHQLLAVDPMNPDSPQKDTLSSQDWQNILESGPNGIGDYPYTGIDPHMIENYQPRNGTGPFGDTVDNPPGGAMAYPMGGGPDPISGREWQTNTASPQHSLPVDREYACIFPLATPRDCSKAVGASGQAADPLNNFACDCLTLGLPATAVQPLCGINSTTMDYTEQYYAKTYPTIRELTLAYLMGQQGIISSLCPIHINDNAEGDDPLFGYRPAITAIVNRLKNALSSQCLPQPLNPVQTDAGLQIPCVILATIPGTTTADASKVCNNAAQGLEPVVDPDVLASFQQQQNVAHMTHSNLPNLADEATCQVIPVTPLNGTCATGGAGGDQGWCYVTGANAGACATQAILFTPNAPPNGAQINVQCILQSASDSGAD